MENEDVNCEISQQNDQTGISLIWSSKSKYADEKKKEIIILVLSFLLQLMLLLRMKM